MFTKATVLRIVLFLTLAGQCATASGQSKLRIRIGTAAPDTSIFYEILEQMRQDMNRIGSNALEITILPGGTQGDEATMLDRVRTDLLQGAALSGVGLSHADDGISALTIPMMIGSWAEWDAVWEKVRPSLEERIDREGFVVLNWAEVGFVRFFTKKPAKTLDDIRAMKLFTSAGDPEGEQLYRDFGFRPVPMAVTDMVPNLITGVIDAFAVPPLFALADQSFSQVKHMIDLKFAPLVGATVVRKDLWERVPAELRPRLLSAARQAVEYRRDEIRRLDETSVNTLADNGVTVTPLASRLRLQWQQEIEDAWTTLRGRWAPAELFDEVLRIRNTYRGQRIEQLTAKANATKNPAERRRYYTTILEELEPDNAEATQGLITTLMALAKDTKKPEERRALYEEVLTLDPEHKGALAGMEEITKPKK